MRIAVVDDEVSFAEYIGKLLENELKYYNAEEIIDVFGNPKEFMISQKREPYDYLLLDIEMPEIDGFKVARHINRISKDTVIIFISNYEHLVFDSFDFSPMKFIRKQFAKKEIKEIAEKIVKDYNDKNAHLIVCINGRYKKILYERILYFEHHNHTLTLYTNDEEISFRDTIGTKELELKNYNFVRIHLGYLVNLKYIKNFENDQVVLKNGTILPVSRKRYREAKEQYLEYITRNM